MAYNFIPTDSKDIFVGRDKKQEIFTRMLSVESQPTPEWIIHIPGDGGVGKTRLLERLNESAQNNKTIKLLITKNLVDFYNTNNQTSLGFLQSLAEQIGIAYFQRFIYERRDFDRLSGS